MLKTCLIITIFNVANLTTSSAEQSFNVVVNSNKEVCILPNNLTVFTYHPLIIIISDELGKPITNANCANKYDYAQRPTIRHTKYRNTLKMTVANVSLDMGSKWICRIEVDRSIEMNCEFKMEYVSVQENTLMRDEPEKKSWITVSVISGLIGISVLIVCIITIRLITSRKKQDGEVTYENFPIPLDCLETLQSQEHSYVNLQPRNQSDMNCIHNIYSNLDCVGRDLRVPLPEPSVTYQNGIKSPFSERIYDEPDDSIRYVNENQSPSNEIYNVVYDHRCKK